MGAEQLQHTHVVANSAAGAVPVLQPRSQFRKDGRKLPIAVDVRVIQRGRAPGERHQVMHRIENLVSDGIAARVRGDDPIVMHDLHAIDVALHRHGLESDVTRDAVRHVVEAGELVLVDFRRLANAGVEAVLRQSAGLLPVVLEPFADRTLRVARRTRPIIPAAPQQVRVEFGQIVHAGDRSPPATLQRLDAILNDRLFVAAGRHAEQRLERVVARQGRVARVQSAITTAEQLSRHRRRVVPPDFSRNAGEELERLHHAFENRFGPLGRQSDRERRVGIRPHQNQHRHLPPPVGKVNVNLAEVRFQPLAGSVIEWDERLPFFAAVLLDEPANRVVTAGVVVLVPQPFKQPHGRVPLLGRLRFIVGENLHNPLMKRTQAWRDLLPPTRIRLRFSCAPQNLAHLPPRMMKPTRDLPNAHPIPMSTPNPSVIVHREHPSPRS